MTTTNTCLDCRSENHFCDAHQKNEKEVYKSARFLGRHNTQEFRMALMDARQEDLDGMTSPYRMLSPYMVTDVETVAEFILRYYKPEIYKEFGKEYAKTLIESHQMYFECFGVDWISKHDSVTGSIVSFYG